jgi:hypothetical protein
MSPISASPQDNTARNANCPNDGCQEKIYTINYRAMTGSAVGHERYIATHVCRSCKNLKSKEESIVEENYSAGFSSMAKEEVFDNYSIKEEPNISSNESSITSVGDNNSSVDDLESRDNQHQDQPQEELLQNKKKQKPESNNNNDNNNYKSYNNNPHNGSNNNNHANNNHDNNSNNNYNNNNNNYNNNNNNKNINMDSVETMNSSYFIVTIPVLGLGLKYSVYGTTIYGQLIEKTIVKINDKTSQNYIFGIQGGQINKFGEWRLW